MVRVRSSTSLTSLTSLTSGIGVFVHTTCAPYEIFFIIFNYSINPVATLECAPYKIFFIIFKSHCDIGVRAVRNLLHHVQISGDAWCSA